MGGLSQPPEQTQPGLWSVLSVGSGATVVSNPHDVVRSWPTLTGVAHAASRACCFHAGLGTRHQGPVGDRELRDDILHPGDIQERQQHPQELRRRGRAGEPAGDTGSPLWPSPVSRDPASQSGVLMALMTWKIPRAQASPQHPHCLSSPSLDPPQPSQEIPETLPAPHQQRRLHSGIPVSTPAMPLTLCGVLGKSLNLAEPLSSLFCEMGMIIAPPSQN